jgi:ribonuclease E
VASDTPVDPNVIAEVTVLPVGVPEGVEATGAPRADGERRSRRGGRRRRRGGGQRDGAGPVTAVEGEGTTNGHEPGSESAEDFSLRHSAGPSDYTPGEDSIRVTPPASWTDPTELAAVEPAATVPSYNPAPAFEAAPATDAAPWEPAVSTEPLPAEPPRETRPAVVWSSSAVVDKDSPFRSDRDE